MSILRARQSRLTYTIRGVVISALALLGACTGDYPVSARRVTEDPPRIRINEVVSAGSAATGWVELFNPTASGIDLSGWTLIDDSFFGPVFTLAPNTVLAAGGFIVIEEAALPFKVDTAYDLRLMSRFGTEVDRLLWIAPLTPARCPDGGGVGIANPPTRGSKNSCVN